MVGEPGCQVVTHFFERFQLDQLKRFPETSAKLQSRPVMSAPADRLQPTAAVRFDKLPPEIGALLFIVGIAGLMLPGPVGSPFLVAGGLALWPAGFRSVERWFMRVAPGMYQKAVPQMERFLEDLERRYPGSVDSQSLKESAR